MSSEVVEICKVDEIVICTFAKGSVVDIQTAKQMVKERLEFQKGNSYPLMIRLNGLKFASSEARNYMKKEGQQGIKAGAFIVSNPVERIILNFLLTISTPHVPTKSFTNEKEALNWLGQNK